MDQRDETQERLHKRDDSTHFAIVSPVNFLTAALADIAPASPTPRLGTNMLPLHYERFTRDGIPSNQHLEQ